MDGYLDLDLTMLKTTIQDTSKSEKKACPISLISLPQLEGTANRKRSIEFSKKSIELLAISIDCVSQGITTEGKQMMQIIGAVTALVAVAAIGGFALVGVATVAAAIGMGAQQYGILT